jgi:hypothetical protein
LTGLSLFPGGMMDCDEKHERLCRHIETKTGRRREAVDARLDAIDKANALRISKEMSPTNWIAIAALIIALITLILHLTGIKI